MRRWNGWGDETINYRVQPDARQFLEHILGPGTAPRDVNLAEVTAGVPKSRLPAHPLVSTSAADRVMHARGQSFPDWVALRSGRIDAFPDGVAMPTDESEVRDLLRYAREVGAKVIPYGGGTSVVGHINPTAGSAPVLTISMARMNRLTRLDDGNRLATFGAGVTGPDLEAQLRAQGYTLGHFPQSFELSTLGGWIAARSSGQQSLHYGRIERLFAGGKVETPIGTLELPFFPASAAGPDLKEMVLGSEGRLGLITEASVRISPLPEKEYFVGIFFSDFDQGVEAVRAIAQAGIPVSMMRLSNPVETATNLALAGHKRLIGALERLMSMRGVKEGKCMLILGFTGLEKVVKTAAKAALAIVKAHGGINAGQMFGKQWAKSRFRTPYLRNTLWEMGYAVDTVETAAAWSNVPALMNSVEKAIQDGLADLGEMTHVFTHLSHVYPTGSSVYTTYVFRIPPDPDETLRRWQNLKKAASLAIGQHGGTISHQHGVGVDHRPYLTAEKGELGISALRAVMSHFDPNGMLNPGKLIE